MRTELLVAGSEPQGRVDRGRCPSGAFATHVKDLKPRKDVPADEWCFFSCTPVGDGLVDNYALARLLRDAGFQGFLAVEVDALHPDYEDEDVAVERSVRELRKIADAVDGEAAPGA